LTDQTREQIYAAERSKRYRARFPDRDKSRVRQDRRIGDRHIRVRKCDMPFSGVDGEGGGVDELGRQNFLLLRAGDRELYTGKHLSTNECLEFLCGIDPDKISVGFYFNYDATMILRDLPKERLDRLFAPWSDEKEAKQRQMFWTWYGEYGIKFLPRQFLSVCRSQFHPVTGFSIPVNGSIRTIYETGGFFQGTFVKQLRDFAIGTIEQQELIANTKNDRSDFIEMTPEIRYYNKLECDLLADLMEQFRTNCYEADISPRTWNGAGKLAGALHKANNTPTKKVVWELVPKQCLYMAHDAYYGGRFEVTRIGQIEGPIYEYDISSAYPDAMRGLPCLLHGRWKPHSAKGPSSRATFAISVVHFKHPTNGFLFGLPIRQKKGSIQWPAQGNGTYWSCEIESAKRLGAKITYVKGWEYECKCDCHLFDWVEQLFIYRKSLGKSGRGYPIKLGINSLYGLLAQRVGSPKFGNFLWAGLITARCRSKLNQAIAQSPKDICMIATDGIYSKAPLDLPLTDRLGDWEQTVYEDGIFIVKPGLWWAGEKTKTRGVAKSSVVAGKELFLKEWDQFVHTPGRRTDGAFGAPIIPVKVNLFTGLKLANARGKPETAGKWISDDRMISFDWSNKRRGAGHTFEGLAAVTKPYLGGKDVWTVTYSNDMEAVHLSDIASEEMADLPDATTAEQLILGN
jgi:hypothetical protein